MIFGPKRGCTVVQVREKHFHRGVEQHTHGVRVQRTAVGVPCWNGQALTSYSARWSRIASATAAGESSVGMCLPSTSTRSAPGMSST